MYVWSHGVPVLCVWNEKIQWQSIAGALYAPICTFFLRRNTYYWLCSNITKFNGWYFTHIHYSSRFEKRNNEVKYTHSLNQTAEQLKVTCGLRYKSLNIGSKYLQSFHIRFCTRLSFQCISSTELHFSVTYVKLHKFPKFP